MTCMGVERLVRQLPDARGGRVVLISHCLLNENTRYLGGACQRGGVPDVVQACLDQGLGMVQMPCPEEGAWGGVLKRHLLRAYGARLLRTAPARRIVLRAALPYTRWRYRRLARAVAAQVADYRRGGMTVTAVLGVDGSPSCGVRRTLDGDRALAELARADRDTLSAAVVNGIVRDAVTPGQGLYTRALERELRRRGIDVPFLAHDLIGELDGLPSSAASALRDTMASRAR